LRATLEHFSDLVSKLALRDLEAPHRRPGLFGIEESLSSVFASEPLERGARLFDLAGDLKPVRVRDVSHWVVGNGAVVDQRIERVFLPQVLEEVLLAPSFKHPVMSSST